MRAEDRAERSEFTVLAMLPQVSETVIDARQIKKSFTLTTSARLAPACRANGSRASRRSRTLRPDGNSDRVRSQHVIGGRY